MLERYCSHSKQCNNNVVTLCCAKIVPCNITLRTSIMKFACWGACGPFRISNAFQIDVLNLVTCSSTPGFTWEPCSVVEVPEEAFLPADKSLDEQKKWLVGSNPNHRLPIRHILNISCNTSWLPTILGDKQGVFREMCKWTELMRPFWVKRSHVLTKSSSKQMPFACTCLTELRERTTRFQNFKK